MDNGSTKHPVEFPETLLVNKQFFSELNYPNNLDDKDTMTYFNLENKRWSPDSLYLTGWLNVFILYFEV